MKKITVALIVLMFVTTGIRASAPDKAGYALIDKFVVLFDQMTTAATVSDVDPQLQEMMAMAKKAKAEGRITQDFFSRYARLLMVVKLITMPDRERILAPVADIQFSAFIRDVSGTPAQAKVDAGPTVAALAKSITLELDALKKQLDQQNR